MQSRVDNGAGTSGYAAAGSSNIGWTHGNNYNSMPENPFFPKFPQMPYFPFPQFQFPQFQFPNFAPYPNVYNNQPNHQHGQLPYPQQPLHPMPSHSGNIYPNIPNDSGFQQPFTPQNSEGNPDGNKHQTSTLDHRYNQENGGHFATDSFFASSNDRDWTQDKESKWQATTKAPFFENTVPGKNIKNKSYLIQAK